MKLLGSWSPGLLVSVAPYTGAWIETSLRQKKKRSRFSSPLHGGVD